MTDEPMPSLYVRSDRRRYAPADPDAVLAAARRIVDARTQRGISFTDPRVAARFFQDKLAGAEREIFAAALLDTRHRLIHYVELFYGSIDGAEVHLREVVKQVLRLTAAAIIRAHNHPSGDAEPLSPIGRSLRDLNKRWRWWMCGFSTMLWWTTDGEIGPKGMVVGNSG